MPEFQFDSVADFIDMGGYGFFVWAVYLIFAGVVAYNLLQPLMYKKKLLKQLQARANRERNRQQANSEFRDSSSLQEQS